MQQYLLTIGYMIVALLHVFSALRLSGLLKTCAPASKRVYLGSVLYNICMSIPLTHLSFKSFQGQTYYQQFILGWILIAVLLEIWGEWS